ncbi:MAG: alanine racemase [Myxococcales bacterium]|nr:alanine racemase [Myxococcales bacterium]
MSREILPYELLRERLRGERLPCAFVNLDAFDRNVRRIVGDVATAGKRFRPASKSIRSVDLLRRVFDVGGPSVRGVMTYTTEEAAFLHERGFDDLLIAYPSVQPSDLETLAKLTLDGANAALMVDDARQIDAMSAVGRRAGTTLRACLELDVAYRPVESGALHLGVLRSPIRDPEAALTLVRHAERAGGVRVVGIMAYEAQVAGLPDANPFTRAMNPLKRLVRRRSVPDVAERRARLVERLRAAGVELQFVNGGGTGSIDTTSTESVVTEVTAGSGFYCPTQFDYYSNIHLLPAAFFACQVVRIPKPGMVTCQGGGYIASGEAGPDKVPVPWLPAGASVTKAEAAGEVQTPVLLPEGVEVAIGDPVIFRHFKAGELCERFNELILFENGEITGRVPTYRGEGKCFL